MWKEKIATPIVEPAAEIHHPDTDWAKNKSADTEETRVDEGEKEKKKKKKKKRQKQREEEEVSCI